MSSRYDRGAIIRVRSTWFGTACLVGLLASGCDKIQLPQSAQLAVNPADSTTNSAVAGSTSPATGVNGTATGTANVQPAVDPKAVVAAFLQKTTRKGEIEDADLLNVTQLTEGLDQIETLDLAGSKITDKGMATLSKFPKLTKVVLGGTPITNAGIEVIKEMPQLSSLALGHTAIDDRAMLTIGSHKGMKELYLNNTILTDVGLKELENLDELEVLDVSGTQIRGAGFVKFRGQKHLRVLHAQHSGIQNEAYQYLTGCPIEDLNVDSTGLTDLGMIQIGKMNDLKKLSIEFNNVTDFSINKMTVMKDLEFISVRNNPMISGVLFNKLVKSKNLKDVNVVGTRVTPAEVAKLMKLSPGVKVAL